MRGVSSRKTVKGEGSADGGEGRARLAAGSRLRAEEVVSGWRNVADRDRDAVLESRS